MLDDDPETAGVSARVISTALLSGAVGRIWAPLMSLVLVDLKLVEQAAATRRG